MQIILSFIYSEDHIESNLLLYTDIQHRNLQAFYKCYNQWKSSTLKFQLFVWLNFNINVNEKRYLVNRMCFIVPHNNILRIPMCNLYKLLIRNSTKAGKYTTFALTDLSLLTKDSFISWINKAHTHTTDY